MKILSKMKDGGPESRVWGYFLIEWKRLFSIVLLRFEDGSRDAYHSHAFNAVSWVLTGCLIETRYDASRDPVFGLFWPNVFRPSFRPVFTGRDNMHKVRSVGRTWVLSFRGPWRDTWEEMTPEGRIVLTHGRREVDEDHSTAST